MPLNTGALERVKYPSIVNTHRSTLILNHRTFMGRIDLFENYLDSIEILDTIRVKILFTIVTWSYNCLQRNNIISYLKLYNFLQTNDYHQIGIIIWNKLVDKFTYLRSSVSSTETDINTRLAKAWTAIDWLSVIWKSDLTYKTKRSFFQAAVMLIQLYGCTTWMLTKSMEKKLDGNYIRMLRAILNQSRR